MTIRSEFQKLAPSGIVELFELDSTAIGGEVDRFYNGTNDFNANIVWNGNTYYAIPIEVSGFELTSSGSVPRPKMKVANVGGLIGALARTYADLLGAKLTRIRTFTKYLDAVNFVGGNLLADPSQEFPRDVYFVDRKSSENKIFVEFELSASWDVQGVMLPRRQVIQNTCTWKYKSSECSYTGGLTSCDKTLGGTNGCVVHFGKGAVLPYGGFPGAGLTR